MKYAANALSHRAHTRFARRRSSARRAREKKPGWKPGQIADKPSPSGGFLFFNGVMLKTPMPTQHE
ncbi:hypothetical protein, partial [Burkholderia mallei]